MKEFQFLPYQSAEEDVVFSKMEITTQHGALEGKTQTNEYIHNGTVFVKCQRIFGFLTL